MTRWPAAGWHPKPGQQLLYSSICPGEDQGQADATEGAAEVIAQWQNSKDQNLQVLESGGRAIDLIYSCFSAQQLHWI